MQSSRARKLVLNLAYTHTEQFDEASKLAASGSNEGLKKISQDQQLKLYGWFKQVRCPCTSTSAALDWSNDTGLLRLCARHHSKRGGLRGTRLAATFGE